MKRFLPLLAVSLLLGTGSYATEIKGQISTSDPALPSTIFLQRYDNKQRVDTIKVGVYGDFRFSLQSPTSAMYSLQCGNGLYAFLINPAEPVVRIQLTVANNNLSKGQTEDSRENNAFLDLSELMRTYDAELVKQVSPGSSDAGLTTLINDYNRELEKFRQFYKGTYTAEVLAQMRKIKTDGASSSALQNLRKNFFVSVNFSDSTLPATPLYSNMLGFYVSVLCDTAAASQKEFVTGLMQQAHQNKQVYKQTAYQLFDQLFSTKQEAFMVAFIAWFRSSADVALLPVLAAKVESLNKVMPGHPLVELNFLNTTGQTESLQATAAKNKVTLLLIWESDCHQCQRAIPEIQKIYSSLHAKGFEVFGVSLDEKETAWKNYVSQNKLTWINCRVNDSGKSRIESYVVTGTPTLVLIDQQGIILHRLISTEQLAQNVEAALK